MVLVDPARVALGLAQGLLDVAVQALARDRPDRDERLKEQVALVRVRSARVDELLGHLVPPAHVLGPRVGHRAQRAGASAGVAGALRVVRLRDQQAARETPRAHLVGLVELLHRHAPAAWVAADVVQRDQAQVAIEGGVLDALRRDRR